MNLIKNILVIFIAFVHLNYCLAEGILPHEKLTYPELNFEIPELHTEKLSSGTELFYLADEGSGVVRMAFYAPGGRHRDPKEKAGLSALLSAVQRSGGTLSLSSDLLNEELENMGAEIKTASQTRYNVVEMKCLRRDLQRVTEIFFDILRNPAYAEERFETDKRNTIDAIKRRDDDTNDLAKRKLTAVIYANHPQGYEDSVKSVSAITRADLLREHARRFWPQGSQMLVVGDLSLSEFKQLAEPELNKWQAINPGKKLSDIPEMKLDFKAERFFVEKENPQIKIRIGHKSVTMADPDYIPLMVMNYILGGGGFNSRITREVRTEMGLAYSVYSMVWASSFYGFFECSCETGFETATKALDQIFKNIERIRTEDVSREELALASDALINSFVFRFVTRWKVAEQMLYYHQVGLSTDYLQKYIEELRRVKLADVKRVAEKYLRPQDMKIVLVGPFSKIRKEMEERFGAFFEIKPD